MSDLDRIKKLSGIEEAVGPSAEIFYEMQDMYAGCLLYTSPSPRDLSTSRMPSSA